MTDTGRARLPALPPVMAQEPSLRQWIKAVTERLEVREGARGNPNERAVTVREFQAVSSAVGTLQSAKQPKDDEVLIYLGGGLTATVAIERFAEAIRGTRLYRDLLTRLDDPDRFKDIAQPIRDILLRSIADEAAARGTDVRNVELKIEDSERSLAASVSEVTARMEGNFSGVRSTQAAFADASRVQAISITQLEASLGNFYQDGAPGRASLQQQMGVFADRINGLRAQYTLRVQAGGALAGFGVAAEAVNGVPRSAFIIMADKFALVGPNYTGGLTNNPDVNSIPFGVDANGIYLNNNVYVRGQMIVDTNGARVPLSNGLRGSLSAAVTVGDSWNDISARQAIWQSLGRPGSAPNDAHLVIGDTVTFTDAVNSGDLTVRANATKYWGGSGWVIPGAVFNGNLLVNGSVAASAINTQGLTIRDAAGNVVFTSGTSVGINWASILGQPSGIYNSNITIGPNGQLNGAGGGTVTLNGLGAGQLAARDNVRIGQEVRFPDGSVMATTDFVNRLSQITPSNISTFMANAAIGQAYIGTAAVGTLQIQGEAVSIFSRQSFGVPGESGYFDIPITMTSWGSVSIIAFGEAVAFNSTIDNNFWANYLLINNAGQTIDAVNGAFGSIAVRGTVTGTQSLQQGVSVFRLQHYSGGWAPGSTSRQIFWRVMIFQTYR